MKRFIVAALGIALAAGVSAAPAPIIDMHLHTLHADEQGPTAGGDLRAL